MNWRLFIPIFDPTVPEWSLPARMLRWLTLIWLAAGLVVLFSASHVVAETDFGDGLYYLKRQTVFALIGLIGFNLAVHLPLRYVLGFSAWLFLIFLGMILLTLAPGMGTTVNGATRWLQIGPIPIQPSELIKPFLVLQCAQIFGRWDRMGWLARSLWLSLLGVLLGAILLQPNLSTAVLCGGLIWLIALCSGLPYTYLVGVALIGAMAVTVSLSAREYQRRRITSFLNPWADPMGDGYQLVQSLLAIGSGGPLGTGYGESQQKLFFLPIQFTDFIFSVFAEEFGFIGGLCFFVMLMAYGTLGCWVALKSQKMVHRLVAIGSIVLLVGQSMLNIGVASGALPTTGLPLPFFSYGGSAMLANLFIAGLLVRVVREGREANVLSLADWHHRDRESNGRLSNGRLPADPVEER